MICLHPLLSTEVLEATSPHTLHFVLLDPRPSHALDHSNAGSFAEMQEHFLFELLFFGWSSGMTHSQTKLAVKLVFRNETRKLHVGYTLFWLYSPFLFWGFRSLSLPFHKYGSSVQQAERRWTLLLDRHSLD